jgi:peptidoglycan/LPS O-acetylase OafA/YrhL
VSGGQSLNITVPLGLLRFVAEFAAGSLVFRAYSLGLSSASSRLWPYATSVAIALTVLTGLADPWAIPLFVVLIWSIVRSPTSQLATWLASPTMSYAGAVSYSTYMIHLLVFTIAYRLPWAASFQRSHHLLMALGSLLCIAFASVMTYRWIETPAREWARALCDRVLPIEQPPRKERDEASLLSR